MAFKTLAKDTLAVGVVTAPAAGTSETWTVTNTPSDTAGAAGLAATAPYCIRVDASATVPDTSPEICRVTATNPGAKTITLSRGYAGTTPVAHALGATLTHIVTGEDLNSFLATGSPPNAHASTHAAAGSDPVTLTEAQITNLTTDLAAKAPLASPTFTGTPAAPTAAPGTNTTQLATTAFVTGANFIPSVNDFTANNTFTIPAGCTTVTIEAVGGGGGGGSGRRGAAATVRGGGGGGGGGASVVVQYSAAELNALGTPLTIAIGAGANSGLARTTDDTDGIAGGFGGTTSITVGGTMIMRALGGNQGAGGTSAAGGSGGTAQGVTTYTGAAGGAGGASGAGNAGGSTSMAPAGGGGGGGISSGNGDAAGGAGALGASVWQNSTGAPAGGTSAGGAGNPGTVKTPGSPGGDSGSGGGSNAAGVGGTGGAGARGAGGGGGGGSLNGNNSGAGGAGGGGWCRIICT